MRKFIFLFVLTFILQQSLHQPAFAGPKPPFPVASKTSLFVQKVTGITGLTNFVASKACEIALGHILGGKIKAKVRVYSFTDLLAGKFKALDVTAKNASLSGVKVGFLHVATNQPLWVRYRKQHGLKPGVLSPVLVSLEGHVSEKDITHALQNPKIASSLSALKLDLPGLGSQQLQILEPKVQLEGGQVKIHAWMVTKGAQRETGVPVDISAVPYLESDAKICVKDAKVESPAIENPQEFALFATELLNPLVNFGRMDRLDHAFRMQSLTVKEDQVDFAGRLILAPKPNTQLVQKVSNKK
jgi:hypothetical protein